MGGWGEQMCSEVSIIHCVFCAGKLSTSGVRNLYNIIIPYHQITRLVSMTNTYPITVGFVHRG